MCWCLACGHDQEPGYLLSSYILLLYIHCVLGALRLIKVFLPVSKYSATFLHVSYLIVLCLSHMLPHVIMHAVIYRYRYAGVCPLLQRPRASKADWETPLNVDP